MDAWKELLLRLLCLIYREWGGDCADLYGKPEAAPKEVCDEYATMGAPKFPDDTSKKDFLSILDDLEKCLDSTSNSLPTKDTAALLEMIAGLRKDLGA